MAGLLDRIQKTDPVVPARPDVEPEVRKWVTWAREESSLELPEDYIAAFATIYDRVEEEIARGALPAAAFRTVFDCAKGRRDLTPGKYCVFLLDLGRKCFPSDPVYERTVAARHGVTVSSLIGLLCELAKKPGNAQYAAVRDLLTRLGPLTAGQYTDFVEKDPE